MRKRIKYLPLIILLFLSIGFAILSSNLSIGSSIAISNASFDVHFEDVSIYNTNINNPSVPVINSDGDTVTMNIDLDKPGDYVQISFYVVNSGTIDAELSEIIPTTLTSSESNYLVYSYQYLYHGNINVGDMLRPGQKQAIIVTYQYKYDIDNFINIDSKDISLSLKYIQPNNYDDKIWTYNFEKTYQTFKAPRAGSYKIELWGAQGGYSNAPKGGYTSGVIDLLKGDTLFVYVGERNASKSNVTTYNGGTATAGGYPGGGATDVRIVASANWKDATSLNSRIMVAGGGGGTTVLFPAAYGGGLKGGVAYLTGYESYKNDPATQTHAGVSKHSCGLVPTANFGVGGPCAGGGGGYWGGAGSALISNYPGGGGGSSYISGHTGCVAIKAIDDRSPRLGTNEILCDDDTTDIKCSYHYSGKYFTNTVMIDGGGYSWTTVKGNEIVGMPTHDGTGTMNGNSGSGYAKITYLG
ncbi:MAG: glycine rich domain-containing protein [Bacilli bacterium]|nr:glycine rich domain-containing protein [Bacilli bacterium]